LTFKLARPHAVVTDIEGTTTPISFVKEILFPYARQRLPKFVSLNAREPAVAAALAEARALAEGKEPVPALLQWIDEDRKVGPLKMLQGMIWEEGYETGVLTAPIYPDAAKALRDWRALGIRLYVYSSGSIPAQKLLFGHTDHGDLSTLFSGWFDLTTGSKLEAASYAKIADAIGGPGLFLSDEAREVAAASAAGFDTVLIDRDNKNPKAIHSFAEISF
jgi:enolase-phosphatase E1